jgi:hypothetical protein
LSRSPTSVSRPLHHSDGGELQIAGLILDDPWKQDFRAVVTEPALAKPVNLADKRKARYQANSAEVRDFYRVNAYPAK